MANRNGMTPGTANDMTNVMTPGMTIKTKSNNSSHFDSEDKEKTSLLQTPSTEYL